MRVEAPGRMPNAVRLSAFISAALAVIAFIALAVAGYLTAGVALGLGLALGSVNAWFAKKSLGSGLPFATVSIARLLLMSAVGLGIGILLLGTGVAWLVLIGLGVSQLVVAGMNAVEVLRT